MADLGHFFVGCTIDEGASTNSSSPYYEYNDVIGPPFVFCQRYITRSLDIVLVE
jgi:hypothetical protein